MLAARKNKMHCELNPPDLRVHELLALSLDVDKYSSIYY